MLTSRNFRFFTFLFLVAGLISPAMGSMIRYDIEGTVIGEFNGGIYYPGGASAGDPVAASFVLTLSNPRLDEGGSGYTRYDTSAEGWITLDGETRNFMTDDTNWRHLTLDISPVRGPNSFFSQLYLTGPYALDGRSLSFFATSYSEAGEQFQLRVFDDFQTFDFGRSIGPHVKLKASISSLSVTEITSAAVPESGVLVLFGLGLAGISFARRKKQG